MSKRAWPFSNIIFTYPDTPHDLPEAVYSHAYDKDDPPVVKQLTRLKQTAMHHVPLRKNNRLLKDEEKSEKAAIAGMNNPAGNASMAQIYQMLREEQQKMMLKIENGIKERRASNPREIIDEPSQALALTDLIDKRSEACLKRIAPSSLRCSKFSKSSLSLEEPVAGDLQIEPIDEDEADEPHEQEAHEQEAHEQADDNKDGDTAEATAPITEPQLTAFEQKMFNAMGKRTAHKKELKKQEVMRRPAAKVTKGDYTIKKKPCCPSEHGSTYYNNGKVYTLMGKKKFRVICDNKKPSTEKSVSWSGSTPSNHEWAKALAHIDTYWETKG